MPLVRRLALLVPAALVGGLLFPVVSAAGGGCHPLSTGEITQARGGKGEAKLEIIECSFRPAVIYAAPGMTLTWENKDQAPHSVSGVSGSWGTEDLLELDDTTTFTFQDEGVYPYYCVLHPGMVGAVVVGDPDPGDLPLAGSVAAGPPPSAQKQAAAPVAASDSVPDWVWLGAIVGLIGMGALALQIRKKRLVQGF